MGNAWKEDDGRGDLKKTRAWPCNGYVLSSYKLCEIFQDFEAKFCHDQTLFPKPALQ